MDFGAIYYIMALHLCLPSQAVGWITLFERQCVTVVNLVYSIVVNLVVLLPFHLKMNLQLSLKYLETAKWNCHFSCFAFDFYVKLF